MTLPVCFFEPFQGQDEQFCVMFVGQWGKGDRRKAPTLKPVNGGGVNGNCFFRCDVGAILHSETHWIKHGENRSYPYITVWMRFSNESMSEWSMVHLWMQTVISRATIHFYMPLVLTHRQANQCKCAFVRGIQVLITIEQLPVTIKTNTK